MAAASFDLRCEQFGSLVFPKMPERIKPRLESYSVQRERDLLTRPNIRGRKSIYSPARINPFDFQQALRVSNSTLRTLDHFFHRGLPQPPSPPPPHSHLNNKIPPGPALRLNAMRPRRLAHRRRRRQRTILSTEPGSRPVAWLSQRQHRSLKRAGKKNVLD